jgi:hypothetical protein
MFIPIAYINGGMDLTSDLVFLFYCAWGILSFARVRDTGLHWAHTLWFIVPLGAVVLGCIPSDYQWAQDDYKKQFRGRVLGWILWPLLIAAVIGILAGVMPL